MAKNDKKIATTKTIKTTTPKKVENVKKIKNIKQIKFIHSVRVGSNEVTSVNSSNFDIKFNITDGIFEICNLKDLKDTTFVFPSNICWWK